MKNALRVIAIVVVASLLFGIGYSLGTKKGITVNLKIEGTGNGSVNTDTIVNATEQSTAPSTEPTVEDTTVTTPPSDEATKPADTSDTTAKPADTSNTTTKPADTGSKIPEGTDAIVAKYNEVINNAKKEQNVTIHKVSTVSLTCTDCSVGPLKGIVNTALKALATSSDDTYTLTNGQDPDGRTATGIIQPGNRDVDLKAAGVKNATCTPEGDGYKMVIVLSEEKSTYDGTTTVNPVYHESCLSPLNLATLELPIKGASITQADMTYPGATLTVTVDGKGKVTKYEIILPMSGSGTGAIKNAALSVGIEGSMDEVYEFTY